MNVEIGEYGCIVESVTSTEIVCIADPASEPPVNTKLQVKVNVYGKHTNKQKLFNYSTVP